ncbi:MULTISPECIES: LPS-assembly protein LptD [unclassified Novosphingobium]|uniref:LPS-assembly protein LptD n=1 Tax=unclassified Novosphingobium TaxID=2644732 RepID=UPI000D4B5B5A|nr:MULTISPECIES: LPS assembly protein LptD [unclassified Novosphingobium]PTR12466.1 LPS-assembly protein [Novosphingobium sp. GV055]PUB05867.1 LPS-assembly protein [Novosphingobium sp. GV061]PUB22100.1 LPS-assembly protein [Novosphingobium sp. GV079]PUB43873.1 LPS-assembly protein [Novosphingobium sp. GV027]
MSPVTPLSAAFSARNRRQFSHCLSLGSARHALLTGAMGLGASVWAMPALAQDAPVGMAPVTEKAPAPVTPPNAVAEDTNAGSVIAAPAGTATGSDAAQGDATKTNAAQSDQVRFEADKLQYASDPDVVTATGNVVLRRDEQTVRADAVTWNRKTGKIEATGNIRAVDEGGNVLYTDKVELTDELKAGAMQDLLVVLREGGRLAAREGTRDANGNLTLHDAAFSGCAVENEDGCPKKPSWEVTAVKVTWNQTTKKVHYSGATLRVFGIPLLPLPGLTHTSDFRAETGLLIPDIRSTAANGVEFADTFYWRLGDNKDLEIAGHLYTGALPMISGTYRQLTSLGAFQITGYLTRSSAIPVYSAIDAGSGVGTSQWRGYLEANGKLQFDENWSLTAYGRYASDRTFLRRYDISRDDRLRSSINLERIGDDSYFSLAGWAVQTLRVGDNQGQVPLALPALDWRYRIATPGIGGHLELEANTLAISRSAGQDTQRAFARAQWDLRTVTGLGQEVTFTAMMRGDVYHSDANALTTVDIYRGVSGWQARGIATAAVDVKWPLVGALFGGTQVLTPRVQLVATPHVRNTSIPNEDSRAADLDDSNLFSLNRFNGYDRYEDGVRVTYGFDWQLTRPGWRISSTVGQSYRLSDEQSLLPPGTGLTDRFSDIVGRTDLRIKDIIQFTHRYRLDKDSFVLRRNEIDATIGDHRTYAEIGYLRLNRDIPITFEDLRDREELRAAARVGFARYFSVFASGVVNLTTKASDPVYGSDGFQMLRHRLGVAYTDDCFDLSITWKRDYVTTGDATAGNSFLFSVSLRGLGSR